MKILNVEWLNNIGIVTVESETKIKTYIKDVPGISEEFDIQHVIDWGYEIDNRRLKKLLSFYEMELLKVSQVAEKLNVCEKTVWRLINNGELKAVRIGGLVRVSEDEVDRLKTTHYNKWRLTGNDV